MSKILTQFIWVFLGGGVGSCLRFTISYLLNFSLTSLAIVNILGGVGIGYIMSSFSHEFLNQDTKCFLVIGLLGGFTTFSAFSYEVYQLIQKSQYLMALGFVTCVFIGSILGVLLGHKFI